MVQIFTFGVFYGTRPLPAQSGGGDPCQNRSRGLAFQLIPTKITMLVEKRLLYNFLNGFFSFRCVVLALEAQISEAPFILYGPAGAKVWVIISLNL